VAYGFRDTTAMTIDRRDFIKTAVKAGALATGAYATGGCRAFFPSPDVVVVGAGAFGVWTAYYLRRMGAKVTLVDAFGPGNSRATSGDETRGVRTSYGDRPHGQLWMRWANLAIGRWKQWDQDWGQETQTRLFYPTGDLIMREDWEPFLTTTRDWWRKEGIAHEILSVDDVRKHYPVIDVSKIGVVLHEPNAGVVRSRRACENVAGVFQLLGGKLVIGRASMDLPSRGRLDRLTVANSVPLSADRFVFALGPWMGKSFPSLLAKKMRTPIGYVYYFGTPYNDYRFTFPNLPSYNFPGITGWPALIPDNRGFRVRTGGGPVGDPDASDRWIDPKSFDRPRAFLAERFPLLQTAQLLETRACHYELSVTRNFLVDRHPALSNVWIAGAGNAEGFKFGPVIGEYIAKRVLDEPTDPAIDKQFKIPGAEYDEATLNRPAGGAGAAPGRGGAADTAAKVPGPTKRPTAKP
jgi:glycine/D-amino acid oxidase-like deaminating enzyme